MQCTRRPVENLTNHLISKQLVLPTVRANLNAVLLSQPVGHGRKVFACGALMRGFKSHLRLVVFRVILVPQNNTKYYVQT